MTYTVIECTNKRMLERYRRSDEFKEDFKGAHVEQGFNDDVEIDDTGRTGRVHYLLIEDESSDPNATFRLTRDGLEFWATGVVI